MRKDFLNALFADFVTGMEHSIIQRVGRTQVKNIFISGRAFLSQKQGSILSAAFLIMGMNIVARLVGVIKYRILAHYFTGEENSLLFASFFPSETLFGILVSGSLAAAFIPVFASLLSKGENKRAWDAANITQTTILIVFLVLSAFVLLFAGQFVGLIPNVPAGSESLVVAVTRFLLLVQIFFILSFTLTAVQETFGRFLVPAVALLFYNLGIITGTIVLSHLGLWGPVIGALFGAFANFAFQVPFARSLGFNFALKINLANSDFRKIVSLALPRMFELAAWGGARLAELIFSFMVSLASYSYFVFANALQLVPVAIFGYSFARAAIPTLTTHFSRGDKESFSRTFNFAVGQVIFFTVPIAVLLAVLRIPIIRIAFGAEKFTWDATVQTGYVLSAFAVGLVAEGIREVLTRSFYAAHDTKTPLVTSLLTICFYVAFAYWLMSRSFGVWGIALAFSLAAILQTLILIVLLDRKVKVISGIFYRVLAKTLVAGGISGIIMFFLLKVLDQAVWDKKLSFLGSLGLALPIGFQNFVLDTRYTMNLVFLTLLVAAIGLFVYLLVAALLKVREVEILARWISKLFLSEVALTKPRGKPGVEVPAPLPPGG